MNIVWFKRDLRIKDHEALYRASKIGPVMPLYILEPKLWEQPDMSYRHFCFLKDCLQDLNDSLNTLGQKLIIRVGDAVEIFKDIQKRHKIDTLWSHQETWNKWTYERDMKVRNWANHQKIPWHEPTQNGVVRRLKSRDGWAKNWKKRMFMPSFEAPVTLKKITEPTQKMPKPIELGLEPLVKNEKLQRGGLNRAHQTLNSFLRERGEFYANTMSSPLTAFHNCSRLSAHIAFGAISIRDVFQACELRHQKAKETSSETSGKWPSAFRAFAGRLRWHCHFIQKLEDEPRIEFENMHSAYDNLRGENFHEKYFLAWQTGKTGFPMIDACMRALTATGWLNFRMRAMLMSFASYHLWLHWREPALHLARLFTDYEPGIHYSQIQMQSGTTGINAIRIYNPIKQGIDHDPKGDFIRRWVPELRNVRQENIHKPWKSESKMNEYPMPIIEEKHARKTAAALVFGLRKNSANHKLIADKIADKHGSRKSNRTNINARKGKKIKNQGVLPL